MQFLISRQPAAHAINIAGFTMVELMISLVLGSLLTFGIAQIYLANRSSQELVNDQSRVQQNMRLATETFRRMVSLAGYRGSPVDSASVAFAGSSFVTTVAIDNTGSFTVPDTAAAGGGSNKVISNMRPNSEALLLRFEGSPDGLIKDCRSMEVASGFRDTVVLYVDDRDWLRCWSWQTDPAKSDPKTEQVLEDVQSLSFQLGVDDNGDSAPNRYLGTGASYSPNQVVAVRVRLVLEGSYEAAGGGDLLALTLDEIYSVRNRVP